MAKSKPTNTENVTLSPPNANLFQCADLLVNNGGIFIDALTAAKGHKKWLEDVAPLNDPDDVTNVVRVSASHFSKKNVLKLLRTPKCNGLRIYHCKSKGSVAGHTGRKYRDLFLMPTHDGVDLIPIKDLVQNNQGEPIPHNEEGEPLTEEGEKIVLDGGILNASMPCPDHCSSSFMI